MALSTITYDLDDQDRVQYIAPGWDRFARDNEAPDLEADRVLGRSLWLFVDGEAVQLGLELLFDSVRRHGQLRRLPFRCDAPATRRFMTLEILPLSRRYLRLRSHLEREEPRTVLSLLDAAIARDERSLSICAWCKSIRLADGGWHEVEVVVERLGLFDGPGQPRMEQALCDECEAGLQLAASQ
jgi:hypothetical protein